MCKEYKVAVEIVDDFVKEKDIFSYDELAQEIRKKGGVLRVAVGSTIDDYLEYYVTKGEIKFDRWSKVFYK